MQTANIGLVDTLSATVPVTISGADSSPSTKESFSQTWQRELSLDSSTSDASNLASTTVASASTENTTAEDSDFQKLLFHQKVK